MEFLLLILLTAVSGWVLGIVGFFKARRALAELAALRAGLAPSVGLVAPAPTSAPVQAVEPEPAAAPEPAPAGERLQRPKVEIEVLLTQRWGIWLGAAALLLAAVFLVRTAVEQEWLGPGARCVLAGVLGAGLVGGAEWLRRWPSAGTGLADLGPGALAAGGVAALFAGAYGAGPLYLLVPPLAAFALLAGAGFAGLALALRFGGLVGVVGLVGAFATPLLALPLTGEPDVPGLFLYLLVVSAAAWAVVRYTAWVWLGWAAALAGAGWTFLYAAAEPSKDAWAPGLFVPAAVAVGLALLPGAAGAQAWAAAGMVADAVAWRRRAICGGARRRRHGPVGGAAAIADCGYEELVRAPVGVAAVFGCGAVPGGSADVGGAGVAQGR